MRKNKHSNIPAIIKFMFLLLICTYSSYAQKKINVGLTVSPIVSFFSFDKSSDYYTAEWDNIDVDFNPKFAFSTGAIIQMEIAKRFKINSGCNYMKWGGHINSKEEGVFIFSNLEIDYKSIFFPILLSYDIICCKSVIIFYSGLSFNIDYYREITNINNYDTLTLNYDIGYNYKNFILGFGYKFPLSNKFLLELGVQYHNDILFNNKRKHNYYGYFLQNWIPLKNHFLSSFIMKYYSL